MYYELIVVSTLVNNTSFARTIVNTSCLCYRLCNPMYTVQANLKHIKIKPFYIEAFDREKAIRPIQEVAVIDLDLEGFTDQVQFYITPLSKYNMYLGIPQIRKRRVGINRGEEEPRYLQQAWLTLTRHYKLRHIQTLGRSYLATSVPTYQCLTRKHLKCYLSTIDLGLTMKLNQKRTKRARSLRSYRAPFIVCYRTNFQY